MVQDMNQVQVNDLIEEVSSVPFHLLSPLYSKIKFKYNKFSRIYLSTLKLCSYNLRCCFSFYSLLLFLTILARVQRLIFLLVNTFFSLLFSITPSQGISSFMVCTRNRNRRTEKYLLPTLAVFFVDELVRVERGRLRLILFLSIFPLIEKEKKT